MKNAFLLLLVAVMLPMTPTSAQTPETVYSFALVRKPTPWYKQQIEAWKKVIDSNPGNGLAWYNYYYANRNYVRTDTACTLSYEDQQQLLNSIGDSMAKHLPDAYEYHLIMWMNHSFDLSYKHHLEKVLELGEGRIEHIDYIINAGEIDRDLDKRNDGILRKEAAGLLSPGMMYTNRNVLAGLKPRAILITAGDNDTYPAFAVQAHDFRSDVLVINSSLILITEYRQKICKELGIPEIKINWEAKKESDPEHRVYFNKHLVERLANNPQKRPVYVAASAMHQDEIVQPVANQLYLTGLAYLYSSEVVDELAALKDNFEHHFTLDYILYPYYHDISESLVPVMNQNYIVPMLKLYHHYSASGDLNRKAWIRKYLLKITEGTSSEAEVRNQLN